MNRRHYTCLLASLLLFLVTVISSARSTQAANLVHQWTFNGDLNDSIGGANGVASGGAHLFGSRLSLNGAGQVLTSAIPNNISSRTLIAWVSLNNLSQGGGSPLSIEIGGGNGANGFDAINYNELGGSRWMEGSNFFQRTQNPQLYGSPETVTNPNQVMMAISYAPDNSISIYRNGTLYGQYTQGSLQTYNSNDAHFIFGPRHDGAGGPLNGYVNEARVYDAALSQSEIQSIYNAGPVQANPSVDLIGQWTFQHGSLADSTGHFAPLTLHGNAQLVDDGTLHSQLQLNAATGDYAQTGAYTGDPITEKTLVSWVYVDDLNARGGSVLTLENNKVGDTFDGIIYAERQADRWMAGSDGWNRTQDLSPGFAESTTGNLVQMAITYKSDNSIEVFRNGISLGTYTQGALQSYDPTGNLIDVLFGKRHDDAGGLAFFTGRIEEARIYDRVLTAAELNSLVPVPEPNSILLAMFALAGLAGFRRRIN